MRFSNNSAQNILKSLAPPCPKPTKRSSKPLSTAAPAPVAWSFMNAINVTQPTWLTVRAATGIAPYVVPGGALSKEDGLWHSSRQDFYLPVKALSKIFRAKFCHELKKPGLLSRIPPTGLANGLEPQLPGCRHRIEKHRLSCSICFQGRHVQQPHRQSGKPASPFSI